MGVCLALQEDKGRGALGAAPLRAKLKTVTCEDGQRGQSHPTTVDPHAHRHAALGRSLHHSGADLAFSSSLSNAGPGASSSDEERGICSTTTADVRSATCDVRRATCDVEVSGYDKSPPP